MTMVHGTIDTTKTGPSGATNATRSLTETFVLERIGVMFIFYNIIPPVNNPEPLKVNSCRIGGVQ